MISSFQAGSIRPITLGSGTICPRYRSAVPFKSAIIGRRDCGFFLRNPQGDLYPVRNRSRGSRHIRLSADRIYASVGAATISQILDFCVSILVFELDGDGTGRLGNDQPPEHGFN